MQFVDQVFTVYRCQISQSSTNSEYSQWCRADGGMVRLCLCSLDQIRVKRHVPDDQYTITEQATNDRRGFANSKKQSRPFVFFSQCVTNQRTGSVSVVNSRSVSEAGWGVNEVGSAGFGSDRFPLVGATQIAACATHIAEISCYAPGHPVDFRVLFATNPINYAEIDSLANDLPISSSSAIYIVLSMQNTLMTDETCAYMNPRANANAVAFVPSWGSHGFCAVNTVSPAVSYDVVAQKRPNLTEKWADLLARIVPRAAGVQDANFLSHCIALHMKKHGSTSFNLSEANQALIPHVHPQDATGLLQLVKCEDTSLRSNQQHVRTYAPSVFMPSLAHQVATDTSVLLHSACSCIYYGGEPWKDVLRICQDLSNNKSSRQQE
jgi:hypothetical protein